MLVFKNEPQIRSINMFLYVRIRSGFCRTDLTSSFLKALADYMVPSSTLFLDDLDSDTESEGASFQPRQLDAKPSLEHHILPPTCLGQGALYNLLYL